MDTIFLTARKFKRMSVNILSMVVIVAIALSGIWVPAKAAFPGDNGKIAFMTNRDSNFEIYVMDSNGANQTNLTNNPAYDGHPSWSPDGSHIAFASERDGNYEIYIMNADGSEPIRLTTSDSTDAFPSWSPDGSQLVFTSYDFSVNNYDIWRMNSDGTGAVKLTDTPTEDTEPVWSPDGSKIAFRSDRDGNMEIYIMNPDGSDQTNLTNHPDADGEPNWSPDGSKIAFASARDNFGAIWVMNADGSEPTRLTDAVYGDGDPAWSPDGTRIVFRGFRHYNDEIYVMNADGTDVTRLTDNALPGNTLPEDWMPDWQPTSPLSTNPHLIAFPVNDAVEGWEWPEGAMVTLTIDNAPGLEWSGTAQVTTWGDPRTYVRFEFADAYNLQIGDTVTLTGEDGTTRVHTIQNLSVTEANGVTDIVSGTADPGATVQVWPHGYDQNYFVEDTAEEGTWVADFGALGFFTIEETGGRSQIVMDGNATAVDWNASWPPSTFTVNTTDDLDDGTCDETHCSLREAINVANTRAAADTIAFNIPGEPPFTIQPQSPLPNMDDPVTLDGTTQPGYNGSPVIELDGTYAGELVAGLVLATNDSTVKGLAINRFGGDAIVIYGSGNSVQSNYLGTDLTGTTTTGLASGPEFGTYDVEVETACLTYDPGTNRDGFISESSDPLAPWSGTSVTFKGTDECGISDPETFEGASLIYRYKLIFDEPTELASIAVSGAAFNGGALRVLDEGMDVLGTGYNFGGNSFQTNYVRLNDVVGQVFFIEEYDFSSDWRYRENIVINGQLPLGNRGSGVLLAGGATNNTVIENLISGNLSNGVAIFNPGTTGNVVQENYIGTDIAGTRALGSGAPGVGIGDQAYDNFIIGNLISGNGSDGVAIFNTGTNGNTLQGNNIGTDASGMVALPNAGVGVWIGEGAADTLLGGADPSVRNVISGNKWGGVSINHLQTTGTQVLGNYIGTDKNGDSILPNGGDGVYVGGSQTIIGSTDPGAGNLISGNLGSGVGIRDAGSDNLVQGNYIGTDPKGMSMTGLAGPPVGEYTLTVMPETCPTYPVGTDFDGFVSESDDPSAPWTETSVHFVGTDQCTEREMSGAASLIYRYKLEFTEDIQLRSVLVSGAAFNGPDSVLRVLDENMNVLGMANTFGGNSFQTPYVTLQAVTGKVFYIDEFDTSSTWRYRQSIVINGPLPLGNQGDGVTIGNSPDSTIEQNVISGNTGAGISLWGSNSTGNVMRGNLIGTDSAGTAALPNGDGVWLGDSASNNMIGGTTDDARNLISGNNFFGISINNPGTIGNIVQGNYIGTDFYGTSSIPNAYGGVILTLGASENRIGGTDQHAGNVISGNNGDGVTIVDVETSENILQANLIGTDATGMSALGNQFRGVVIAGGANANLVAGNVVSGNGAAGVRLADLGTTANRIQGNFIGTDRTGMNPLGNGYIGIRLTDDASDNMIGGTEPGEGNIIAFNAATGIAMSGEGVTGNALLSNAVFSNAGLGIDLGEDDVTLNDPLDTDTGPNGLQNFPVIITATRKTTSVKIHGQLFSSPGKTFRLEFFSSDSCDPSGYGEGQTFLGFVIVKTNPDGVASFKATLPVFLPKGAFVTATATDPAGNTSEFSQCFGPLK